MAGEYHSWLESLNLAHGATVDTQREITSLSVKVGEETKRGADLDKIVESVGKIQQKKAYLNLAVSGIPETTKESLADMLIKFTSQLDLDITANDICKLYCTKNKNIYVQFISESTRYHIQWTKTSM